MGASIFGPVAPPAREPRGASVRPLRCGCANFRLAHPAWGARKLAALLRREGVEPSAASTILAVLLHNGLVQEDARRPQAYGRFERSEPNALWQMDFKGRRKLACGELVHPLSSTIIRVSPSVSRPAWTRRRRPCATA